jgi:hypothetical protein
MPLRRAEWLLLAIAFVPLAAFAAAQAGWLLNPERVPGAVTGGVTLGWLPLALWSLWVLAARGHRRTAAALVVLATPCLCLGLFFVLPHHELIVRAEPRTAELWLTERWLITEISCYRTVTPRAGGWLLQPLDTPRCAKSDSQCMLVPNGLEQHDDLGLAVLTTTRYCTDTPGARVPMALDLFRVGPAGVTRVPLDGEPAYGTWERDAAIRAAVAAAARASRR